MGNNKESKSNDLLNRSLVPTQGDYISGEADLTNCEKEPIHIPGMIQPHGVLLSVFQDDNKSVAQCSRNTEDLLGIPPDELLGRPLEFLFGGEQVALVFGAEFKEDPLKLHYVDLRIEVRGEPRPFCGILHESEGMVILELEPVFAEEGPNINDFEWVQSFFSRVKLTANRKEARQIAAEQVRDILGYDRVMIYEFDEEYNGKVIAEAKNPEIIAYVGQHYPASDIPRQARELYLRNWLRTIVNANYIPVDIVPPLNPLTNKPLNLSLSILRSVSPVHLEYMRNMGVGASMTISLIHDNQLWGLIACHHSVPKYVPHRLRNLCNFLGSFFSSELYQRQRLDDYDAELQAKEHLNRIVGIFIGNSAASQILEQLHEEQRSLLEVMDAEGAAVLYQDRLVMFGRTPTQDQVQDLAAWISRKAVDLNYHTSRLSLEYEPAKLYKDTASGVVYLGLSQNHESYIMWFRPEAVQVVEWGGDPSKPVTQEEDGLRLSPRKSFEKWKQIVEYTSQPWKTRELRALSDLKTIVLKETKNQLRQTEEKALINLRISRENEKRYLQLMETSPVAFLVVTGGQIVFYNQQASVLFRASDGKKAGLERVDFMSLVHEESRNEVRSYISGANNFKTPLISVQARFHLLDGSLQMLEMTIAQVIFQGKDALYVIAREREDQVTGGTSYLEVTKQLQSFLTTDPVTELPNRDYFKDVLTEEWAKAPVGEAASLLIVDIDNFKLYNAMFGLQTGDICLQWVAEVVKAYGSQQGAFTARYIGGSFAMYAFGDMAAGTGALAEQIRQGVLDVQIPLNMPEIGEFISVSVGLATAAVSEHGSPDELVRYAERALRLAKNAGKNQVVVLDM
ncbi:phytochrome Cph1 [Bacillus sp. FJAT-18019]|nr:phytochrome Cph1 [Bacillus sp. FJAT-18019]